MASYFPMVKNANQRVVFPILDADGDPVTGAAADTPDSEYSLDGATFVDCSDEIHEIATASGIYYLDLLAGETNGDCVAIQIKTATAGTKTTVLVFYTSAQSLNTTDTAVDGIQTDLSNVTDGLGALKALLDTISGYTDLIDDATDGLAAIKAEVEGLAGSAMRGTDSAALASAWTSTLATALENYTAVRAGYLDELAAANLPADVDTLLTRITAAVALASICTETRLAELDAANLPTDVTAIPTTAMRGTDNAALASDWTSALATALSALTLAAIADGVWDELQAGHVGAGSLGKQVSDIEGYVDELESGDKPPKKAEFDL